MIELSVLSSGSRANSTFISHGETNILIDCGLSQKMLNTRLREIGKNPEELTDIIITHEHSDHVHGVCRVARKTGARIWVTESTGKAWREFATHPPARRSNFVSGQAFQIGKLKILPFSISHDAVDPVGFRISLPEISIGYCTDLGHVTSDVRENLRGLTALVLESNHEPALLSTAPYPAELKARISSRQGHLSNHVAAALLEELLMEEDSKLELVIAGHVSEKANDPLIVRDTLRTAIEKQAKNHVELVVACAFKPTILWNSSSPQVKSSTVKSPAVMTKSAKSATSYTDQLLDLI